jgi:pyrroline-5-carboxylate reductase
MTRHSVGFIGGGRVARIMLEGWKRAQQMPERIMASDPNPDVLGKLKRSFPGIETAASNPAVTAAQDIIFLAVHPPAIPEVATGVKGRLKGEALLISLSPKFTIAKLSDLFGGFSRIARVIPNAPSVVNFGYNPVCFGPGLKEADQAAVRELLEPLGECPEVAESKLEGYALLTGMGPTYLWFQLQALREAAAGFGLADEEISPALKRMVCGSARTLLESGLKPAEVMDLIPVKPLADMEPQVLDMYRTRLPALFQKIKP